MLIELEMCNTLILLKIILIEFHFIHTLVHGQLSMQLNVAGLMASTTHTVCNRNI